MKEDHGFCLQVYQKFENVAFTETKVILTSLLFLKGKKNQQKTPTYFIKSELRHDNITTGDKSELS